MIVGMLLALCAAAQAWAQTDVPGTPPRAPVDSGAIIMPPKDAPPAAEKPAGSSGGEAAPRPPPKKSANKAKNKAKQGASKRKGSKDATCKGPAELCKQSSPR